MKKFAVDFKVFRFNENNEDEFVTNLKLKCEVKEGFYGPNVRLVKILDRGKEIPFGEVQNYVAELQGEPWAGFVLEDLERAMLREYWNKED